MCTRVVGHRDLSPDLNRNREVEPNNVHASIWEKKSDKNENWRMHYLEDREERPPDLLCRKRLTNERIPSEQQ